MRRWTTWIIGLATYVSIRELVKHLVKRWEPEKNSDSSRDQSGSPNFSACQDPYPTEGEHRAEEQAQWRWQRKTEQRRDRIAWITLGLSVMAIVAAGLSYWQSQRQANSAQGQLTVITEDQRAWVAPVSASVESGVSIGRTLIIGIPYQNFGHSPAKEQRITRDVRLIDQANLTLVTPYYVTANIDECKRQDTDKSGSVTFPTGVESSRENIVVDGRDVTSDLLSGSKALAVLGCMSYLTGSHVGHTAFCYYFRMGDTDITNLPSCANGSYAD